MTCSSVHDAHHELLSVYPFSGKNACAAIMLLQAWRSGLNIWTRLRAQLCFACKPHTAVEFSSLSTSLPLCLYIYIYIRVCMRTYQICTHGYTCVQIYNIHIQIHIHIHIYIYIHIHIHVHVHIHICIYIYMYNVYIYSYAQCIYNILLMLFFFFLF